MMSLEGQDPCKHGVVTHSSGNHAAALALAAKLRNIPAHIVVPSNTPKCKVDAVRASGGTLYFCQPSMDAREAMCGQIQRQTGATFIPPYNHSAVMSGQGTIALELLQQVPDLDCIIVPVSGGGMISGIAVTAAALQPGIKVVAAEPVGTNNAADVARAKEAGCPVACDKPSTIADGLQGRLGDLTWPIVRDLVAGVVTVTEEEIVAAMRLVFERLKVVVEPSGAVGLAAALSERFKSSEQYAGCHRVGIILCGGNVDLAAKGLWDSWL